MPRVERGVRDGKPELADGQVLDVANIVWSTGYRPDFGWLTVPGIAGDDGWPNERRGITPAPGLSILGLPFTYSFSSMLIVGAGRDAAYVVDHIAARARAGGGEATAMRGAAPASPR